MPLDGSRTLLTWVILSALLAMLTAVSCAPKVVPGSTEDDITLYKRELRVLPDDTDARYQLGVSYYKLRDYGKSVNELEEVVRKNPNLPYAYNNLGLAYVGEGRLGKAVTAYLKALQLERSFLPARLNLGVAYYLGSNFSDAGRQFRKVLKSYPDNIPARQGLGLSFLKRGNRDEAIAEFNKVLGLDPKNADAYKYLGTTYEEMGDTTRATADFRESLRLNPHDAETHWYLANIYFDQDYLEGALREYTYVVDIKPDFKEARFRRALTLKELGGIREATVAFDELLELDANYPDAHYQLGTIYQERAERAEKAFERLKGTDRTRLGPEEMMEQAITEYNKELENNPDNIKVHKALGDLYLARKDNEAGLYHYARIVKIDPDDAQAVHELGGAYAKAGMFSLALVQWRRAADLDPDLAIEVWKQVLGFRPSMAEAHYRLGMAYLREGKLAAAVSSLNLAVQSKPNNVAFKQALSRARKKQKKAIAEEGRERVDEEWWN